MVRCKKCTPSGPHLASTNLRPQFWNLLKAQQTTGILLSFCPCRALSRPICKSLTHVFNSFWAWLRHGDNLMYSFRSCVLAVHMSFWVFLPPAVKKSISSRWIGVAHLFIKFDKHDSPSRKLPQNLSKSLPLWGMPKHYGKITSKVLTGRKASSTNQFSYLRFTMLSCYLNKKPI